MDKKSATTAITSILTMLPEELRFSAWKASRPINPNQQEEGGPEMRILLEQAVKLYREVGVRQEDIIHTLIVELDKVSKEPWTGAK